MHRELVRQEMPAARRLDRIDVAMMSAIVTSGVASFSTNRSSRDSQAIGVASPCSAISSRPYLEIGSKGSSLTSLPAMIGISSSSSVTSWRRIRLFA